MAGKIRVLPADLTFEVEPGESVFRAAQRQGVRWPSICNGDCECGICYMVVESGAECLSERGKVESDRLSLGMKANEPRARLACRTQVSGEATVTRRGVKWAS
jgi:ferredoxin